MKTYLTYGAAMAGGGFLLVLILYILGFHSDASKLGMARGIQACIGIAIGVTCIVLGTKAKRATVPHHEEFGYGRALAAGVMITLFASLFGIVTTLLYSSVINPDMNEIAIQAQIAKWQTAGMSDARIEQAEAMMRKMMSPPIQAYFGFLAGMVFGTIISLITSGFMRREAVTDIPPAAA